MVDGDWSQVTWASSVHQNEHLRGDIRNWSDQEVEPSIVRRLALLFEHGVFLLNPGARSVLEANAPLQEDRRITMEWHGHAIDAPTGHRNGND